MDQLGLLVGSGLPDYKCRHQQSGRGRAVTKEELKPGDIAVISGDDAHVVMFLGWDEATGDMICIHESAGNTNNVTVSHTNREWTDYRSLVE